MPAKSGQDGSILSGHPGRIWVDVNWNILILICCKFSPKKVLPRHDLMEYGYIIMEYEYIIMEYAYIMMEYGYTIMEYGYIV